MKKSLKRLLCLVLSVLLFTMSLPVLAADTTEETTTGTEENTTTETNLQGLDLLETLNPTKVVEGYYTYVIDSDEDWNTFVSNVQNGTALDAKVLLKKDINLNEGFTFQSTEGSGDVKIAYKNRGQTKIVNIDVDGNVNGDSDSQGRKPTEADFEKAISPWTPIGTKGTDGTNDKPFRGVFNAFKYDDKGNITGVYTISGLYINPDTASDNVGLFGYIDGAKIAGVRIQDSYIRGKDNVGALVGNSNHSSNIIGCVNGTGSVVIGKENVGGVVGSFDVDHTDDPSLNDDDQDHIYECVNRGYVYGKTNVGGIVGYTYHALIRNSFNMHADTKVIVDNTTGTDAQADEGKIVHTGYVEGTTYVGGIVGRAVSTVIYGCTNYGVVTGYDSTDENGNTILAQYVGGIVGQLEQIRSYLREGVNARSATVTGKEYVGGIVGYLGETENNPAKDADETTVTAALELFMAYNHGTVNGTDKVGGLVGYNATRGKVFNSYSNGPVLYNNAKQDKDAYEITTVTDAEGEHTVYRPLTGGNLVGLNAGEVRDCFYYPNMYAEQVEQADGKMGKNEYYKEEYKDTVIGNGIGINSTSEDVYHVSGLKVLALKSEAVAYLLNLVYLKDDPHNLGAGYHHLVTHGFSTENWVTPTYWMAGDNGPEFTESTSLAAKTIKKAQLLLNQNFNLKFTVDVPSGLSQNIISNRLVVVYQEGNPDPLGKDKYTMTGFQTNNETKEVYYEFTLTGIEPHYLGDNFEVIFTAEYALPEWDEVNQKWNTEGVTPIKVYEKRDYSVLDYCTRQLNRTQEELGFTSDDAYHKFVTLICNVLEYGAQYQIYRQKEFSEDVSSLKLVNEVLKEKNLKPTIFWELENTKPRETLITANFNYNADNIYASNTLVRFGSANALGLILYIDDITKYDNELVVVEIIQPDDPENPKTYTIADLKEERYGTSGNYFMAVSDPMSVTKYKASYIFKVKVSQDETALPTITYSMEHFVASLLECGDRREPAVKALWDYYCAAMQYQKPESSDDDTTGGITLDTDNIFDADIWQQIKDDSQKEQTGVPKGYVKLNISDSLARLLSIFNPLIRIFFDFEIVEYESAWYARPYPYTESNS